MLSMRLKVPPQINQFVTRALDKNQAETLFKLLLKYRPEDKKEKKDRLKAEAEARAAGERRAQQSLQRPGDLCAYLQGVEERGGQQRSMSAARQMQVRRLWARGRCVPEADAGEVSIQRAWSLAALRLSIWCAAMQMQQQQQRNAQEWYTPSDDGVTIVARQHSVAARLMAAFICSMSSHTGMAEACRHRTDSWPSMYSVSSHCSVGSGCTRMSTLARTAAGWLKYSA